MGGRNAICCPTLRGAGDGWMAKSQMRIPAGCGYLIATLPRSPGSSVHLAASVLCPIYSPGSSLFVANRPLISSRLLPAGLAMIDPGGESPAVPPKSPPTPRPAGRVCPQSIRRRTGHAARGGHACCATLRDRDTRWPRFWWGPWIYTFTPPRRACLLVWAMVWLYGRLLPRSSLRSGPWRAAAIERSRLRP